MEEDIKKIKLFIKSNRIMFEDWGDMEVHEYDLQRIEKLIKRYRELEQQNELYRLTIGELPLYEGEIIPKSKIKEKIDELKQEKDNTYTKFLACNRNNESLSTKGKMLEGSIQVLQELMEDK